MDAIDAVIEKLQALRRNDYDVVDLSLSNDDAREILAAFRREVLREERKRCADLVALFSRDRDITTDQLHSWVQDGSQAKDHEHPFQWCCEYHRRLTLGDAMFEGDEAGACNGRNAATEEGPGRG